MLACLALLLPVEHASADPAETSLADALLSDYRPGQGFHIPDTGFNVGGYLTGEFAEHQSPALTLSNASLLIWWESDSRFSAFSEIDFQDGLKREGSLQSQTGQYLALERLYLDYALFDTATLRIGKYLTPIGRWNQTHADPLVWTTSRPLVTEVAFPTNATGVMLLGSSELHGIPYDYAVYAAQGQDVDPTPNIDPFRHAVGARLNVSATQELQVGGSLASFQQNSDRNQNRNLVGLDFDWQRRGFEISGEALTRISEHSFSGNEKGLYLQAVAPVADRLYLVYRFEVFRAAGDVPGGPPQPIGDALGLGGAERPIFPPPNAAPTTPPSVVLNVLGLTYRFRPNLVGKIEVVEGRAGAIHVPVGVLSSISVLF